MICPHCSLNIAPTSADRHGLHGTNQMWYGYDAGGPSHRIAEMACPECNGSFLMHSDLWEEPVPGSGAGETHTVEKNRWVLLHP